MPAPRPPIKAAEEPLHRRVFKARKKSRLRKVLIGSVPQDFERWEAHAQRLGLNFTEYARRALNAYEDRGRK
jgi:hypothetical protein